MSNNLLAYHLRAHHCHTFFYFLSYYFCAPRYVSLCVLPGRLCGHYFSVHLLITFCIFHFSVLLSVIRRHVRLICVIFYLVTFHLFSLQFFVTELCEDAHFSLSSFFSFLFF